MNYASSVEKWIHETQLTRKEVDTLKEKIEALEKENALLKCAVSWLRENTTIVLKFFDDNNL